MKFNQVEKKIYKTNELSRAINLINNLGIKTPPHEFINFSTLENNLLLKFFFKTNLIDSNNVAMFNSSNNQIEIFSEINQKKFIHNNKNFNENSFIRLFFDSCINKENILTLTFIHEIGHYIQHQDFKINNNLLNNPQNKKIHDFIIKTLFYNSPEQFCKLSKNNENQPESKSRKDNNEHLHRIITESFSDVFSYIIFNQINNDKNHTYNVLESHLNARKNAREASVEYYFTDSVLFNVLNDLKQGKSFNSLIEIKNYINYQIESYIPKFLNERLIKDDDISVIMNNRYLGYISKRLQINNIDDLYQKLDEIGVSKNVLYKNNIPKFNFNNKEFQNGILIAESFITEVKLPYFSQSILPEKTTSIKNISSLRNQYILNLPKSSNNKINL